MPSTQSGMLQVQVGESNSQKKKKKKAYKSPLLDPIEVGELYVFEYNLFLLTYMRTQKSLPLRLERERERQMSP